MIVLSTVISVLVSMSTFYFLFSTSSIFVQDDNAILCWRVITLSWSSKCITLSSVLSHFTLSKWQKKSWEMKKGILFLYSSTLLTFHTPTISLIPVWYPINSATIYLELVPNLTRVHGHKTASTSVPTANYVCFWPISYINQQFP